ncbi:hypothetical protein GQ55_5G452600 [Panicum hallii var. hallii]|uniref:Uncharacterized protein n=1 Tax=Panicum hallii var. hallii TaxID=1504633 RepID=A0A2T7DQ69_9POAL|nr:hypothetical protein GQ55_5G452600 [Panicum hallii var. hallii]
MKFFSRLSSLQLQAICALMAILLAITISSCSVVVRCSEVEGDSNAPIDGAPVAHLDGGRRGLAPPPPRGGPVRAYFVEPPPPPAQRRRV